MEVNSGIKSGFEVAFQGLKVALDGFKMGLDGFGFFKKPVNIEQ